MAVGIQKLRPQRPHRQVQHDHHDDREQQVVERQAPVLRPAPALRLHEVGIGQVHQRAADGADHRQRDQQRVEAAVAAGHLEADEAAREIRGIEAHPQRRPEERQRQERQQQLEHELEPRVRRARDEHERAGIDGDRPLPGLAPAEEVAAHLAGADRHVGLVHVAHHDRGGEKQRCVRGVQAAQPVGDPLAVGIAELVARDRGDEHEAHEDRGHQHPHQRVAVAAAGDTHVHDVAGAEPRQDHDDAGPERAQVLAERPRNGWGRGLFSHASRSARILHEGTGEPRS